MNRSRSTRLRRTAALLALALGCGVAAPVFAGSHVSVSVGVGLPGLSIGYSDYRYPHYRHHRDHYGYRGRDIRYSESVYYAPPPVVIYRRPVVVERPVHVRRDYYGGPVVYTRYERHGYRSDHRYRDHDRRRDDHDRRDRRHRDRGHDRDD